MVMWKWSGTFINAQINSSKSYYVIRRVVNWVTMVCHFKKKVDPLEKNLAHIALDSADRHV